MLIYWVLLAHFPYTLPLISQCFSLFYFVFFKPKLRYQCLFESLRKQQLRGILPNIYVFNLISFTKLLSLSATSFNAQETFQRGLNVVVRVISRRDVGQYQIKVETTFCMSTLKFTPLNNVKPTLSISILILTTLDSVEKCFYFQRRVSQRRSTSKHCCENDHFQKSWKEQKNIFELQKKRWLIWSTTLAFDCDQFKRKRNIERTM